MHYEALRGKEQTTYFVDENLKKTCLEGKEDDGGLADYIPLFIG